jgi:hypothetical protein
MPDPLADLPDAIHPAGPFLLWRHRKALAGFVERLRARMSRVVMRYRNPRRAYEKDGTGIPPMTLANMRENGVRDVLAYCEALGCGHEGRIECDRLPDDLPVPDVSLRLRCSKCRRRQIKTVPDWSQGHWHRRFGGSQAQECSLQLATKAGLPRTPRCETLPGS